MIYRVRALGASAVAAVCLAVLSAPSHAQGVVAGHIVNGDSYGAITSFEARCNDGSGPPSEPMGSVNISSFVDIVNLDGDIVTIERNHAEDPGERIIMSAAWEYQGPFDGNATFQLEPDGTGFVALRGRDGSTVSDELIYEVTARFDCSGATENGELAVVSFESFHRNPPPDRNPRHRRGPHVGSDNNRSRRDGHIHGGAGESAGGRCLHQLYVQRHQ